MDWFEQLTGFREGNYADTRAKLKLEGHELQSLVNGRSYGIGELELVSLQSLRERVMSLGNPAGRLKLTAVSGDVRRMHHLPANAGALFQVASQFNLLEMTGPGVAPEVSPTIKATRPRARRAPSLPARPRSTGTTLLRSATITDRRQRASSMDWPTLVRLSPRT